MKIPFRRSGNHDQLRKPAPTRMPVLESASVAALYRAARTGGDFFDFEQAGQRLVFLLLDIAGKREQALDIAADVQPLFHEQARMLLSAPDVNEAEALSGLMVGLNRELMEAADGVRCAPGFLGSYSEELGMLFYINAGHIPGLLRDHQGVALLEANGLPLGLFTHATHDAQAAVLEPGAALLLASRGLVESRTRTGPLRGAEFGLERLKAGVASYQFSNANQLCSEVLAAVEEFTGQKPGQNDITTLALMRSAAVPAAALP